MLRLAIMNDASKKNMMSINGMISIRAFLCGNGVPIFIGGFSGRLSFHRLPKFHGIEPLLLRRTHHDLHVGSGGFQLELKLGQLATEIVEGDECDNRDGHTAHPGDEPLANTAGDLPRSSFPAGIASRNDM